MSSIIYKWRVYCNDGHGIQYTWNPSCPITCPLNVNHSIDNNLTAAIEKVDSKMVTIKEEHGETGGNFKTESKVLITAPNSTSNMDVTWNYPISVLEAYFVPTAENLDDELEILVAPNTTIGVISQNVSAGSTSCVVSASVINHLYAGYRIHITNGITMDNLGRCLSINKDTNTIMFEYAAVNNYNAGSYFQMTVPLVEKYIIGPHGVRYIIGEGKIGGSFVPANTIARLVYINKSNATKKFYSYIEYLY